MIVFRAIEGGRIISGFPYSCYERAGSSVFIGGLAGTESYFNEMMSGFFRMPYLCETRSGSAIVVRSLAAAASLCVALVFGIPLNNVLELAAAGELDGVVLPPQTGSFTNLLNEVPGTRETNIIRQAYRNINTAFGSSVLSEQNISKISVDMIQKEAEAACAIARLAACACVCRVDERVFNDFPGGRFHRKYNGDIFRGFTLLSLLACSRCSPRREAELIFTVRGGELLVEIECDVDNYPYPLPELDECRRLADRRHLLFDCATYAVSDEKRKLNIRFSPVIYDWSVLGVKSQVKFDYNYD